MKRFKLFVVILVSLIALLIAIFWQNDLPFDQLKTKYSNSASKFISIDGVDVHYRDEGLQTDSIPLVLIHGTGASLHTWEGWVKELKDHKRIVTFDLPAYGLTGPHYDRDYSTAFYVKFIDSLLQNLSISKFVIGGNSLGGGLAWNYTLKYPDKVEKLILVDASGPPSKAKSTPVAFKIAKLPLINSIVKYITPRWIAENSIKNVYVNDDRITNTLIDRYWELSLRLGNRQAFIDRMTAKKATNTFDSIGKISQETLLLWGDQDFLIPVSAAKKFEEKLLNDTLVIFKNLGHAPMEEDPKLTSHAVKMFLKIKQ
jgi:pimeloyl-ACP methyl ester carboxylesterase